MQVEQITIFLAYGILVGVLSADIKTSLKMIGKEGTSRQTSLRRHYPDQVKGYHLSPW